MGKYQDWLHYQEIGRMLRDELASQLHERARLLAQMPRSGYLTLKPDNCILNALLVWLGMQAGGANSLRQGPQRPDLVAPGDEATAASVSSMPAVDPVTANSQQTDELADLVVQQLIAELQQAPADPLAVLHELTQSPHDPLTDSLPFQSPQLDIIPGTAVNTLNEMQTQPRLAVPWWLRNETPAREAALENEPAGNAAAAIEQPSAADQSEYIERRDTPA
jgi:hypothetical protein